MTKKKISYEQSLALEHGRNVARKNQRQRGAAKEAEAKAKSERALAAANHSHSWSNWEYVLNHSHEVRECRKCGFAEIRSVML